MRNPVVVLETRGLVCPVGATVTVDQLHQNCDVQCLHWECRQCHYRCSPQEIAYLESKEQEMEEWVSDLLQREDPQAVSLLVRRLLVENQSMHVTHSIIFHALQDISAMLVDVANSFTGQERKQWHTARAVEAMHLVGALLRHHLPPSHYELVVHHDRLAQLHVAAGNIAAAKEEYRIAKQYSCLSCGETTPSTVKLQQLVDYTPTTIEMLRHHYNCDVANTMARVTVSMEEDTGSDDVEMA